MTERQLQLRVGLFVLVAVATGVVLTIQFGKLQRYIEPRYVIGIQFDSLSGVQSGTPIRQFGIPIGRVKNVKLDHKSRKVIVVAEIRETYPLALDAVPTVSQSLLGDAHIEFSMGQSREAVKPGYVFKGTLPQDPLAAVQRLESRMSETLVVFAETSREWQGLAQNVNSIVETNQGSIDEMVENAARSLTHLTITMQKASVTLEEANRFIADPELQNAVKQAMIALPRLIQQTDVLIQQTQQTIRTTNTAVKSLGNTMDNLETVTDPLAANSDKLITNLATSLNALNQTLAQLSRFSRQLNEGDGSIQRLSRDPQLYQNLQTSTASLAALLRNLDPIVRDMRVFSDKVARHPELLGVSGYLRGSSGLKEAKITPASSTAPATLSPPAPGYRYSQD